MPEHGGDARLVQPIHTVAGGSGLNTATHLSSLLRHFWTNGSGDGDKLPRTSNVNLQTVINENDDHGKLIASHCNRHEFALINRRVSSHPSCYCGTNEAALQSQAGDKSTGHCAVIVSKGDRSFMTHLGCMEDFRGSHILTNFRYLDNKTETTITQNAQHVHIAGYYNIAGFWDGELAGKLAEMRETQTETNERISISLVPQQDATNQWDGGLLNILQYIDFLILSEIEVKNITKYQSGDKHDCNHSGLLKHVAHFSSSKVPMTCIIVTLGSKGAAAFHNGEIIHEQKTCEIDNPTDPTGAGDAFAAGFLHGYLSCQADMKDESGCIITAESVKAGMHYGCATGTSCIMVPGASVPSKKDNIERIFKSIKSH